MQKVRIYEIKTETPDTPPGRTYDRFNIAATNFIEAVEKARRKLAKDACQETIQAVNVIASEG